MRALFGLLMGILLTYFVGALIAWSWNPGDWWMLWRLICFGFAIFWGFIGLIVGSEADADATYRSKRK